VWLARRTLLPVLISGGLGKEESPPESVLMKQLVESEYALPVRWIETESVPLTKMRNTPQKY